ILEPTQPRTNRAFRDTELPANFAVRLPTVFRERLDQAQVDLVEWYARRREVEWRKLADEGGGRASAEPHHVGDEVETQLAHTRDCRQPLLHDSVQLVAIEQEDVDDEVEAPVDKSQTEHFGKLGNFVRDGPRGPALDLDAHDGAPAVSGSLPIADTCHSD